MQKIKIDVPRASRETAEHQHRCSTSCWR